VTPHCRAVLRLADTNLVLAQRLARRVCQECKAPVKIDLQTLLDFGFTEEPDVPAVLSQLKDPELKIDMKRVTYFLGREILIASRHVEHMGPWRENLFVAMQRNATNATSYFRLPTDQVVELGSQVEI